MENEKDSHKILILEDDQDQMDFLVNIAQQEIQKRLHNLESNDNQVDKIVIVKLTNLQSLKKAVSSYDKVILALMDCNIPDRRGGKSNDQLVKTNYKITGQHNAVDTVLEKMSDVPITLISAKNRFKKIIRQYYESNLDITINFIEKEDHDVIAKNIRYYLNMYLNRLNQ